MFTLILFPTDFSDVSAKAADYVRQLREAGAEEVVILHVIDTASYLAPGGPSDWRDAAVAECQPLVEAFTGAGLRVRIEVEMGDPGPIILRTAEAEKPGLIVMGATGKNRLTELLLGSVSEAVVRKAHVPVLVVKP